MKRIAILCLIVPMIVVMVSAAAAAEAGDERIRVLVVTGGHGFERKPFFEMFREMPQISFQEAKQKNDATAFERDDLLEFQVILLYDMMQQITDSQKTNLLAALENGVGLVALHHALVSYQDWPDYEKIIGGRYPENQKQRGRVNKALGYRHDVEIPVRIMTTNHPVTAGLEDFLIRDEIYWGYRVAPEATPLLTTTHPDSGNPLAWYQESRNSRVVTIQLGDSPSAYENPSFRRLLGQSIQWTAKR